MSKKLDLGVVCGLEVTHFLGSNRDCVVLNVGTIPPEGTFQPVESGRFVLSNSSQV